MVEFEPLFKSSGAPAILCLGAHSDDLEIGAGGALLEMAAKYPAASIHWVVFSGVGNRCDEARASAEIFTAGFRDCHVDIHAFRDGFFPYEGEAIKSLFEQLKADLDPDIVFTHCAGDRHQDHRMVSEFTWQTFRNHLILEYEIPKYDGDLGQPNFFIQVSDGCREAKLRALENCFASQRNKDWFTRETFMALMRLRGIECRSVTGYAEAFYCRKALFHI